MHMALLDASGTMICRIRLRPDAERVLDRMADRRAEIARARSEFNSLDPATDPGRRVELARVILDAECDMAHLWASLRPSVYGGEMPESVGDDGADVDHPRWEFADAA